MQFLSIEIRGNPAVVIIVLIVLIVTPIPDPFCYQKFINYAGRTHLIFTNIYVINISDCCEFCQLLCFLQLSQNPRFNPFYSATSTFPDLSQRVAQIGTQASTGGMDGRLRIPLFSLSSY